MAENGSSPLARGTLNDLRFVVGRIRFIPARTGNTISSTTPPSIQTVHPRSHGEHVLYWSPAISKNGSSPLARGTPPAFAVPPTLARFIPARTGNTICVHLGVDSGAVHPRSHGEHSKSPESKPFDTGSSPLARGTRIDDANRAEKMRFIPARTGNTSTARMIRPRVTVHPRSHGEHSHGIEAGRCGMRFIPARTGNTPLIGV